MTRLDQLAQPTRRNGEHIRSVIERQRQHQIESINAFEKTTSASTRNMSRSLTHLAHVKKFQPIGSQSKSGTATQLRPLRKSNTTKSMTQLVTAKLLSTPKSNLQNLPAVVRTRTINAKTNPVKAIEIEIDSRTTNVSVAGVFTTNFILSVYIF